MLHAEAAHNAQVVALWRQHWVRRICVMLAGLFSRLSSAGYLRTPDPDRARQFVAVVVFDQIPQSATLGTDGLTSEAITRTAPSTVWLFLRCYGPVGAGIEGPQPAPWPIRPSQSRVTNVTT
jgi:hypothetical protein